MSDERSATSAREVGTVDQVQNAWEQAGLLPIVQGWVLMVRRETVLEKDIFQQNRFQTLEPESVVTRQAWFTSNFWGGRGSDDFGSELDCQSKEQIGN